MEDTKHLLLMFLLKTFQDRPKVVENTYQLIYNYNNGKKERDDYQKTLKGICELMNGELPSEILVYLLTLVDMPHNGDCDMPQMEKLQRSQPDLAGRVHEYLLDNMNHRRADDKMTVNCQKDLSNDTVRVTEKGTSNVESKYIADVLDDREKEVFVKPVAVKKGRARKKNSKKKIEVEESSSEDIDGVKPLLDIAAAYVIQNENQLRQMYKTKLSKAWDMINSNNYHGEVLNRCYTAVKDTNDKMKLLRCIENDCVEDDILVEAYGKSELFTMDLRQEDDPFELSEEQCEHIKNFVTN